MTQYLKRWVGIDPGDRWMGVSILTQIDKKTWTADMRVIDIEVVKNRHLLVKGMMHILSPKDVVLCENYQIRRAGHQSFNVGETLRLIGALEFATLDQLCDFVLVMPGDPNDINDMFFGAILKTWQEKWMRGNAKEWDHARSAWRVMLIYLMSKHPDVIRKLQSAQADSVIKHMRQPTMFFWPPALSDLYTYPMVWEFK